MENVTGHATAVNAHEWHGAGRNVLLTMHEDQSLEGRVRALVGAGFHLQLLAPKLQGQDGLGSPIKF